MSADILRQAASLMRKRAMAADSGMAGPWYARVLSDGRGWVHGEFDALSLHGYPSVAQHMASWHPDSAIAVSDQLEAMAAVLAEAGDGPLAPVMAGLAEKSLAVARAYLGTAP